MYSVMVIIHKIDVIKVELNGNTRPRTVRETESWDTESTLETSKPTSKQYQEKKKRKDLTSLFIVASGEKKSRATAQAVVPDREKQNSEDTECGSSTLICFGHTMLV